jgi:di/tricarboxylate transporter
MLPNEIFVCVLVLVTIALFIWEKWSPDIVSMGILLLLFLVPVSGVKVPKGLELWQALGHIFSGSPILGGMSTKASLGRVFGNDGALTVAAMFVVGAALDRTGVVERLARWFQLVCGTTERRIMFTMAGMVIVSSAFMNNTTVVVLYLPVIVSLCRKLDFAPSRFLIPLSYFAIVGGLCTKIGTSTNIIVSGIVDRTDLKPISMFEITPLGVAMCVVTVIFFYLFGRQLLPTRTSLAALIDSNTIKEYMTAAIVSEESPMAGQLFSETALAKIRGVRVLEVRRSGDRLETPLNQLRLEPGDRIIFKTPASAMKGLSETEGLAFGNAADRNTASDLGLSYARTEAASLMEGVIGPKSRFIGHSLRDLNFRQKFGVFLLAIHRDGANLRELGFDDVPLEVGDTLLLEGTPERLRQLFTEKDFINLSQSQVSDARRSKAWWATGIMVLLCVLGATIHPDTIRFEVLAIAAALLVVVTRCLDSDEAYQAIEWKIVFMIFGTLGLGIAMEQTGAAKTIVQGMLNYVGSWDIRWIISAVLLFTILLTELLSNTAVAMLLTPLAITMGSQLGIDPRPFIIAVMFGSSIGFAVPAGYQTHMLVYGAGGYRFSDFCRAGIALDILLWAVGTALIPIIWKVTVVW